MNLARTFIWFATLLLAAMACQYSNPAADSGVASISVSLNLPDPDDRWERTQSMPLPKTLIVGHVTLRINGPGMDEIVQDLDLNLLKTKATGTLEVPKGDHRIFAIFVRDEKNILQYVGRDTTDILGDNEVVNITTEGIYPAVVNLSVPRVGVLSVDLDWARSSDGDFESYEVVRSNSPNLLPGNRISLRTITNQSNTDFTDLTTAGDTEYYYAVIVWDTEGMGMRSDPVGIRTGQFTQIAYDDNNPFSYYFWPKADQGSANLLTAPGTVRVVTARFYIADIASGGAFRALVLTEDASLKITIEGQRDVTATSTGWFIVDFSADNIVVNGDFYVMMQYNGIDQPGFGYDPTGNGRAWDYDPVNFPNQPWAEIPDTYFMRAIVEQPGGLLKELAPVYPEGNPAFSAPRGQLPAAGPAPASPPMAGSRASTSKSGGSMSNRKGAKYAKEERNQEPGNRN